MRSTAVLFRGATQVMNAYRKIDIPAWALWSGKELMFSYSGDDHAEGEQLLQQTLQMLVEGESQAILSLRIYDDLSGKKINNQTAFTNSFNFALIDPEDGYIHAPAKKSALMGRITALEEQLAAKKEQDEPQPSSFMDRIGAILDRPEIQDRLIGTVVDMVRQALGVKKPIGTMGNVTDPQPQSAAQGSAWEQLPTDQQHKLRQAMEILMVRDPQLGDHMLALSQMSESKYKMALSFL